MNLRPELTESEAVAIAEKIRDEMIQKKKTKDICADLGWTEPELERFKILFPSVQPIIQQGIDARINAVMHGALEAVEELADHVDKPNFKNYLDLHTAIEKTSRWYASKFDRKWGEKTEIEVNATVKRDMTELTDEQLAAIATGRTGTASETQS